MTFVAGYFGARRIFSVARSNHSYRNGLRTRQSLMILSMRVPSSAQAFPLMKPLFATNPADALSESVINGLR